MNSSHSEPVVITRIADRQWHAVADGRVVGYGDASSRPDGRTFLSIDSWHDAVFDQLAASILADLPTPLYTVVDETDHALRSHWERVGFTTRRREWEYLVPTDPRVTGLQSVRPPAGVTIVPMGEARMVPLRELDRVIRDEVEKTVGWREMPAEVVPLPPGMTVVDPATYTVAVRSDHYVGLVRLAARTTQPRIGLVAVRADEHRRGIARALLADVLARLHRAGTETAVAEVTEANTAATALFDGIGARRAGSNLELVRR